MGFAKSAVVLAGVFIAAGMGSAVLTQSFGQLTGQAEVETGPVFYAAPDNKLIIFDQPGSGTTYEVSSGTITFGDETFGNNNIEEAVWYSMSPEMYVKADVKENESFRDYGQLRLTFSYIDGDNNVDEICSTTVNVSVEKVYSSGCTSSEPGQSVVAGFLYEIKAASQNMSYQINAYGDTRVEVDSS